ncbi:hypothetical protein [Bartonella sp. HY761]|uniref:hypothetical protein n=1 Tax=Bartonella sp. HY761 TaxID=2979330 RepID=UPI00220E6442|nr:hypothetical protein [Bartonella sp. HY761]UXN06239.1 hypothetical protein N6A79_13360 [Bartonella sp. HY761]
MKYTLLLLLLFSVKNSFAVDSIWINYKNLNNHRIFSLKECIKKEDIYINKFIAYDKNSKNITALDYKFKLYEYYNSSIEIYFYDNGHINYDNIIYYYTDIKKEKFKNIFNKKKYEHYLYEKQLPD